MDCQHISDCIEDDKLTTAEKKTRISQVKQLAKRFNDSKKDIELAQSVVNQESTAAIKAYNSLRLKLIEQQRKQGDEFEYLI